MISTCEHYMFKKNPVVYNIIFILILAYDMITVPNYSMFQ